MWCVSASHSLLFKNLTPNHDMFFIPRLSQNNHLHNQFFFNEYNGEADLQISSKKLRFVCWPMCPVLFKPQTELSFLLPRHSSFTGTPAFFYCLKHSFWTVEDLQYIFQSPSYVSRSDNISTLFSLVKSSFDGCVHPWKLDHYLAAKCQSIRLAST